jgi:putative pyruvate formate lyase activating enzyme
MTPNYLKLCQSGELKNRIQKFYSILESCELCPRKCRVNRLKDEKGYCRSGKELTVSSYGPHFGEEDPLVGKSGSGTIFLSSCNLLCVYCQNYDISHEGYGKHVSEEEVADFMIDLQTRGCHNINFVTPTHFASQLLKSIGFAIPKGLQLPIIWNCGGYENVEVIKLLDGIVDIYMPDMKYGSEESAGKYSDATDYFESCRESVKEMHRQVGDLHLENGIATRGLLVRHLVLPNDVANSRAILEFIAEEISKDTYVNIMDQYRPMFKASNYKEIARHPTIKEYREVVKIAENLGIVKGETYRHGL